MQSHKRATPQPSPTHQSHTHTKWRQARRQGWHKASVPQQSEAPTTMVFCHHTHSQCNHQASQSKRHLVLVFVARLMPLTHTPQGRGEPWLMTRGVHHGSSHTHTHKWPTHQPQCNTLWCMPWCPSTMPLTRSHTPKEEDHGLMAKVASTTCHHYEREREGLDGGQWTCEHGQATCNTTGQKEAPLKPCSHHSSLHQQPPHHHTHHTSVVMVTHCLLAHTHTQGPRQDKEHTTTKPMVWMACTVTMVWHKRGCGVVLPSSLVQHVVAPTPSKWPRAHHTALQPPQHPCFLVSTHVPQPVHTHPHVCV